MVPYGVNSRGLYFDLKTIFISPLPLFPMIFFTLSWHFIFWPLCALFAFILRYFTFILTLYFPFSLFLSPLSFFSSPFLPFTIAVPPFSLPLFKLFPPNDVGWHFPFLKRGGISADQVTKKEKNNAIPTIMYVLLCITRKLIELSCKLVFLSKNWIKLPCWDEILNIVLLRKKTIFEQSWNSWTKYKNIFILLVSRVFRWGGVIYLFSMPISFLELF